MRQFIERFDYFIVTLFRKYADEAARVALCIIFFWFGILKLFGLSPAGPLVIALMQVTGLAAVPPEYFLIGFGGLEAIVGVLILLPKYERITFLLLGFHFICTALPMFVLPEITWEVFPIAATLTGQYIIKNLALITLGMVLLGRLRPMQETKRFWGEERSNL